MTTVFHEAVVKTFYLSEKHIDDPLTPAVLANKSRAHDPVFNVPILIIAGGFWSRSFLSNEVGA